MSKRTEAEEQRPTLPGAAARLSQFGQLPRAVGLRPEELLPHLEIAWRELRQGLLARAWDEHNLIAAAVEQGATSGAGTAEGPSATTLRASLEVLSGRILQRQGQAEGARGRLEAAAALFAQALASGARDAWVHRDYGVALYELGQRGAAREALEEGRKGGDQSFETSLYLGVLALGEGDWATAEALLRDALGKEPLSPEAALNLAMALERSGREGSETEAADLYLRAGEQLADQGRREEALEAFRSANRLKDDPYVRLALGDMYRQLGRNEEAIGVVEKDPDFPYALGTKGAALNALGRNEEALEALDRALDLAPDYGFALGFRGDVLRLLGRPQEALESLDRAVEHDPNTSLWPAVRGEVLRVLERDEEALAALARSIDLDPDVAFAHGTRAAVLSSLGQLEEALAAADRAIELDASYVFGHCVRGEVLGKLGRAEESLEAWDRAVELLPESSYIRGRRGEALEQLDRLDEALAELEQAAELNPDDAFAQGRRGEVLRRLNRPEEAIEALDQAVKVDPSDGFAQARRAEVLRVLNRLADALAAADEALTLELSQADEALAQFVRGDVLRLDNRWEEALAAVDRAIELRPDLTLAYGTRGEVLRMLDRAQEAREALERARELDPEYAFAIASLGEVYRMLGRYRDARSAIQRALEISGRQYAWAQGVLGIIELDTGELEPALKAFEGAVELDSAAVPFAHLGKGHVLRLLARFEESRSALEAAVEQFPDLPAARVHLAQTLIVDGRGDDATAMLRQAADELEALPEPGAQDLSLLGWSQALLERYDDAMRTFLDALAIDPTARDILFDIALTAMRSRRYDLWLEEYQRAIKAAAEHDEPPRQRGLALLALRALEFAVQVNDLQREGSLEQAIALLQQAATASEPAAAPTA